MGASDLGVAIFIVPSVARLYKAGDLARYISADGDLEYVGRIDEQIKVHGYRIEPGEIEGVLAQHPAVRECVVVAREDAVGDRQLVAYIVGVGPVPTQEAQPLIAELQKYLRELLPSYMVPSWFVLLKALPLTVNGKVDRRSLPAPESQSGQEAGTPIASRTAIQELLAQLWCEVLGRSQVSIFDSFFELGGHSLLATRLMAQIQAILQVELPVRAVFEEPTLVGLAQRVEQALRKSEGIVVPPLMPMERPEKIPLSFAQQRLWFIDQLEPDSTAYLAPYALYLHGELNVGALERGLRELVYRHECLRTTFEMRDEQPVQVIHPAIGEFAAPTSPAYLSLQPVIDLQGLKEEQREEVARCLTTQEAERPCNLAKGPLLRTYLLQLKHQKHVLLLTLHHIITDGWSNEVLVRDLTTLYRAKVLGQPSPLAPLPIQYADYALWQREWMSDGVGSCLSAQLTYWRKQLANLPRLELLVDYPRLASQTYQGATLSLDLSEELSQSLVRLSRQEGVTLFMLGLAAFQVLLMRYTGQTNIHVGTPIANRTRTEIEGVIGFFVNTLVIRTDLSGNPMFLEVLKQVREVCLSAYTYQDLPFEKLVEVLQPERDSSG
ncbi:MAG: non-ribosomal peptide synthetase, partial [Chloroflexi bacterium]